jgi:hypothetical protein
VSWFDLPGLHLDQAVLVPCQGFEFSDLWTIRFQAPQIGELGAPVFGEQIRIDLIGFGARCATLAIDRLGVDRIDGVASGKQGGNQQAVVGFDDAGHLLFPPGSAAGEQKVGKVVQACGRMGHPARAHWMTVCINDDHIVVIVCPIDACKPHDQDPPCKNTAVPGPARPFTEALAARFSNHRFPRNTGRRRTIFQKRSSRVGAVVFRLPHSTGDTSKRTTCSSPVSRGLISSLL